MGVRTRYLFAVAIAILGMQKKRVIIDWELDNWEIRRFFTMEKDNKSHDPKHI